MAKGIYVGGSAPKFTTTTTTVNIDTSNIGSYFTVTNGSYYFVGYGSTFITNNGGIGGSTAQTTLTALYDISNITFTYSYSSESGWDKFTLTVAGTTVENAVSGATTTKTYSGSLSAGSTIIFKYAKDGSVNSNDDECTFSNMTITAQVQVPDGTIDNVARKVIQPYIGVDNVARKVADGYIGVDNVARRIFGDGIVYATWKKWSCYKTAAYYEENLDWYRIGETDGPASAAITLGSVNDTVFRLYKEDYTFTTTSGYQITDTEYFEYDVSSITKADFESVYVDNTYMLWDYTSEQRLVKITSIDSFSVGTLGALPRIEYTYFYEFIGYADYFPESYEQGYQMLDTMTVPEGELPESGTLIEGSADGSYCVLKIGSTYYYYTRA